jgi:hypothetical protein
MIQELVKDIHSTLKNYSVGLKQQNYLLEKAWTLVDGNLNVHRLIFKKKGVLRAFKNGNLEDNCTWDYEPSINSLIIKIGNDAVVLNEIFLDGKVLILRQDNTNDFLVFINNELLQGDQLEKYLMDVKSTDPGDDDDDGGPIMPIIGLITVFIILVSLFVKCNS